MAGPLEAPTAHSYQMPMERERDAGQFQGQEPDSSATNPRTR